MPNETDPRPRVVIIGAGFAGLYAARTLAGKPVRVTVLDRTNHHLFQPLLYQVATAVLAPTDITAPIRWLLRAHQNIEVLLGAATRVDVDRRVVEFGGGETMAYDYLILATGANHSYFGHPEWEQFAPGLKSIEDATEIRRRFLLAFEEAEKAADGGADQRTLDMMMTFVIVGGGPTGVELAGILPDVTRRSIHRDFRHIDTRRTRVILLEGGPRVLPSFPESLSEHARHDLEQLGVHVRTGAMVTKVDAEGVMVGDERIAAAAVFWGAGNEASPLAKSLGVPLDRAGRVKVEPDLTIPGHPEVFAVGDVAFATFDGGRPVPGVAPAAMQMGRSAAENIVRTVRGGPRKPFDYFDKGNLATIGRNKAVGDFGNGKLRISGLVAWCLWLFVHLLYLAGFRNRASVLVEWAYAYFTWQRGARLITRETRGPGAGGAEAPTSTPQAQAARTTEPSAPHDSHDAAAAKTPAASAPSLSAP